MAQSQRKITVDEDYLINLSVKMNNIEGTLCGDSLHPNGIISDIKTIKEQLVSIDKENRKWVNSLTAALNSETSERIRCDGEIKKEVGRNTGIVGSVVGLFSALVGGVIAWIIRSN